MSKSRWLRLNTDWHLSDWLVVLSAESRLAWVQLLCHVKINGFAGKCKSIPPSIAERLWFVNEPSIRQMLQAAENAGALVAHDGAWEIVKWAEYQGDDTGSDRQRRFKNKQKVTEVTEGNALPALVTVGNAYSDSDSDSDSDNIPPKSPKGGTRKVFRKPSVKEICEYAVSRGDPVLEAERFLDFYESKGWKVGRNPMKDWQAAWRNWVRGKNPVDSDNKMRFGA